MTCPHLLDIAFYPINCETCCNKNNHIYGGYCYVNLLSALLSCSIFNNRRLRDPGSWFTCQLCLWLLRGTCYAWGPRICILPQRHHSGTPWLWVSKKGRPRPMLKDRVPGCTSTWCKHPDCFLIFHVPKIYFEEFLVMFFRVHVTHWRLC